MSLSDLPSLFEQWIFDRVISWKCSAFNTPGLTFPDAGLWSVSVELKNDSSSLSPCGLFAWMLNRWWNTYRFASRGVKKVVSDTRSSYGFRLFDRMNSSKPLHPAFSNFSHKTISTPTWSSFRQRHLLTDMCELYCKVPPAAPWLHCSSNCLEKG